MALSGTLDVEVELKAPADKLWHIIRESTRTFPQAVPHQYKSIEVLEGDGKSPGSVRLVQYGEDSPLVKLSKEKIEAVDEAKKSLVYSVIEGDLQKYYKKFTATLLVTPKVEGCLAKWDCYFEKASEEVPNPDVIRDFALKTFHDLDTYLKA